MELADVGKNVFPNNAHIHTTGWTWVSRLDETLELKICVCVCICSVAQWCWTLCNPMDYSPPGSSVHGISQARILEWVSISFSRGSANLGDWHLGSLPWSHHLFLFHCAWPCGSVNLDVSTVLMSQRLLNGQSKEEQEWWPLPGVCESHSECCHRSPGDAHMR